MRFAGLLGLELTAGQAEMLGSFEEGGYQQAVWRCGRRGGKSLLADVLALFDATMRDELREFLRAGETRVAAIIAPRLEQSRAHIRSCRALLEGNRELFSLLESETVDSLRFANGSEIRAYPASARGLRGDPWSSCVLDELGHFVTSEDGNAAGDMVVEAAHPSLAQFGDAGWLVAVSTPLWRQGAFWTLCERAESGRFEHIHYRHLSTQEMNDRIPAGWLEERRREDPDLFAREFLAEFIDSSGSYLPSEEVVRAIRKGDKLRPRTGVRYRMSLDPAYQQDFFAAAIAHLDVDKVLVVDGVWTWRRAGHERVMDEVRDLANEYHIARVTTDQASPVPVKEALHRRRIAVDYRPWTNESKRDAFARLKVLLNTGAVELPNDKDLVEELCSLEARPTPSGMTRIAAARGGHDDRAVAVAALAGQLARRGASERDIRGISEAQEELRSLAGAAGIGRATDRYRDLGAVGAGSSLGGILPNVRVNW